MVKLPPSTDGGDAVDEYVAGRPGRGGWGPRGCRFSRKLAGSNATMSAAAPGREDAPVGQAYAGGWGGGELVHGLLDGEVARLAHEAPVEPGRPRVRAQEQGVGEGAVGAEGRGVGLRACIAGAGRSGAATPPRRRER